MLLKGRVWKIGDNITANDFLSPKYDPEAMNRKWDECAKHALEEIVPSFPTEVEKGDIIVAGNNIGNGHAHYYQGAVMACSVAGAGALLAESFNMLFLRTAIDNGIPAWQMKGISELVENGDIVEFDMATGVMNNITTGKTTQFPPVSPIILDILAAGGSQKWAYNRVKSGK